MVLCAEVQSKYAIAMCCTPPSSSHTHTHTHTHTQECGFWMESARCCIRPSATQSPSRGVLSTACGHLVCSSHYSLCCATPSTACARCCVLLPPQPVLGAVPMCSVYTHYGLRALSLPPFPITSFVYVCLFVCVLLSKCEKNSKTHEMYVCREYMLSIERDKNKCF